MSERKEPTISAVRPESEEAVQNRKRNSAPQVRQPVAGNSPPVRPIIVRSKVAPFALVMAFVGIVFAGYVFWLLTQSQQLLTSAEARIQVLENQLQMSDDESTASVTALQAKVKWADSEIRKLWGVSYDRNRKAIEDHKTQIASLKKSVKTVDAKIKSALASTNTDIQVINDLLDSQQTAMSDIDQRAGAQTTQVRELTSKVRQMEKDEAELKSRIAANEEAITAIDAFRRSVNKTLIKLESRPASP